MRHCPLGAALLSVWPIMTAGCLDPSTRLNAPPQGHTDRPNEMQDQYVYMVDNGMMHDLCVSDVHFVPHTAQLNGLGVRRVSRYAELLEGYGGTVHLDTVETDQTLNQARVSAISTHLASAGLNMNNVKVETGLPQGRGLDAPSALRILAEGTADDAKASGSSTSTKAPGSTK
jgi:hypothetical protein